MSFVKQNKLSLLLLLGLIAISVYFYPNLPENVPTKFDFDGRPTQYSSKEFLVLLFPSMYFFMIGFINLLLKASPENFSMPNGQRSLDTILFGCGTLLAGIHAGLLIDPTGKKLYMESFALGTSLFLIIVGNMFGKTERNFFIGIRAPWTLASEANWRATHRFAGKLMVIFGLALLAIAPFYSSMPLILAALLIPTITPIFYSYRYYQKNEQFNQNKNT